MNPNTPLTRRAALGAMAAGLTAPFVFRHYSMAAPSETLYHASFGAGGMAWSDIRSLSGEQEPQARRRRRRRPAAGSPRSKKMFPDVKRLPGLARAARQGEGPRLGQRLHARPHARPDHDAGDAARAARLHPEAADADDLRGPAADQGGRREEARHPDGHPDPLAPRSTGPSSPSSRRGRSAR